MASLVVAPSAANLTALVKAFESLPGYTYDRAANRYRSVATGQFVTFREVYSLVDRNEAASARILYNLSAAFDNGSVTPAEWFTACLDQIRLLHIQQAALGAGGFDQLKPSDFMRIDRMLREDMPRLRRFGLQIENGELSLGQIQNRCNMYAGNARIQFFRSQPVPLVRDGETVIERRLLRPADHCNWCIYLADLGWQLYGVLPVPGESNPNWSDGQCLTNCKCEMERKVLPVAEAQMLLSGRSYDPVAFKGGPGSGNFGHAGRPGHRGGSSSRSHVLSRAEAEAWAKDSAVAGQYTHVTDSRSAASIMAEGFKLPEGRRSAQYYGAGVYLSKGKGLGFYGDTRLEVRARVKNPYVHMPNPDGDDQPFPIRLADSPFPDEVKALLDAQPELTKAEAFTEVLRSKGYDSVISREDGDDILVVFDPKNVVVVAGSDDYSGPKLAEGIKGRTELREFASKTEGPDLFTHATRTPYMLEEIVSEGIKVGRNGVVSSTATTAKAGGQIDEYKVREIGGGYVVFSGVGLEHREKIDVVSSTEKYPEVEFLSDVPASHIVKVVRQVTDRTGFQIREDHLAQFALNNPGHPSADDLPEPYRSWFFFDGKSPTKGGPGSGNFDHAGRPGEVGGSASRDSAGDDGDGEIRRIWDGKQHESSGNLSKLDTGTLGEKMAIAALSKMFGIPFETVNVGMNNAAFDVSGDSLAIEVKTGLATNSTSAQQWRATIGQPGKEETALLKKMTPEQKREHNAWKYQAILDRKQKLLEKLEGELGRKVKPVTIGVILSGDGKAGDVFMFEGFHLRLGWSKYATDEYYIGTYDVDAGKIHLKGKK